VQTVVNRLEAKGAIRRVDKISNAHVFEAAISQASAQHRMLDELVAWFGGRPLPVMTHLIESGRLTDEEVREARKAVQSADPEREEEVMAIQLQAIANHVCQSTLFAAAVGLLVVVCRRFGPRVRYGLWLAASAKFLIPFSILSTAGRWFGQRADVPIAPPFSFAIEQVNEPFSTACSIL
jgi:Penicillinase repressor